MSESERVMEVWERERERYRGCRLDEITQGSGDVRVFRMREGPRYGLPSGVHIVLVFSPDGVVITGDRRTLVAGGVGVDWFVETTGWDYLASRFLPREYQPRAMADALDVLTEDREADAKEERDAAVAARYRAEGDAMFALAEEIIRADDVDLAEGGRLSRTAVYERMTALGISEPWDLGRGYDPERAGYLAAVRERFRALYRDPWMCPENPPPTPAVEPAVPLALSRGERRTELKWLPSPADSRSARVWEQARAKLRTLRPESMPPLPTQPPGKVWTGAEVQVACANIAGQTHGDGGLEVRSHIFGRYIDAWFHPKTVLLWEATWYRAGHVAPSDALAAAKITAEDALRGIFGAAIIYPGEEP